MPTGTWPLGFATSDVMQAAEFRKGIGCIADQTLGGTAANIDFASIVNSYAHLLVVAYGRGDSAATGVQLQLRFNGDTAANYDYQFLQGQAAVVSAAEVFATTSAFAGLLPAATAGANLFGAAITFIPNYAGSTNNKLALSMSAYKYGTTTGRMSNILIGGFWRSSAAINRITLLPLSGNLVAGTRASVFGIGA